MRHRNAGRKLNRTASHRRALFSSMAAALIKHEQIVTTLPKAKELKRVADRLITLAKRGNLHSRRLALSRVRDEAMVGKLFGTLGPTLCGPAGRLYAGVEGGLPLRRCGAHGADRAGRSRSCRALGLDSGPTPGQGTEGGKAAA